MVFSSNCMLLLYLSAVCAGQTSERETRGESQATASFSVFASGDNSPPGTGWRMHNRRADKSSSQPQPTSSRSLQTQGISLCFQQVPQQAGKTQTLLLCNYFTSFLFLIWSLGDPEAPAGPRVSAGFRAASIPTWARSTGVSRGWSGTAGGQGQSFAATGSGTGSGFSKEAPGL